MNLTERKMKRRQEKEKEKWDYFPWDQSPELIYPEGLAPGEFFKPCKGSESIISGA